MRAWPVMAASVLLGACAHLVAEEEWEPQASHPPLPATFVVADAATIAQQCGDPPGIYLHGCAQRDFEKLSCTVYTRAGPPQWLIEHERRHCDGWDHPGAPKTALGFPK